MARVSIAEVLGKLDLPVPSGRRDVNICCPVCSKRPSDKKLNINFEKDVYYCNKCGITGNPVKLYSVFQGISYEQALEQLRNDQQPPSTCKPRTLPPETPLADLYTRDRVYREMLKYLDLRPQHKEDLLRRGLTEAQIRKNGYRSVPNSDFAQGIANGIVQKGLSLEGVPGFYRLDDGRWTLETRFQGFFIPYRDALGRIQGLQIRTFDNKDRKYVWFSSKNRKDGTGAETWIHLAGYAQDTMYFTEGGLKADVIRALSRKSVLAVPGVNCLKFVKETVSELKKQGLRRLLICYDMDIYEKEGVQRGFIALVKILLDLGIAVEQRTWDPAYKGLDDFMLAVKKSKK